MKRWKIKLIVYVILALSFTSVSSYLDYHNLESGSKFHDLPSYQRNLVRANAIGTTITNPVAIVSVRIFVGAKPRPRKENYAMTVTLFLSLIPSFFLWLIFIDRNRELFSRMFSVNQMRKE